LFYPFVFLVNYSFIYYPTLFVNNFFSTQTSMPLPVGTPVYPYIYPKPKALCNGMEVETGFYHSEVHAR